MMGIGLNLTPRQTRTALDLFTAAVIASVAIAMAGLTWRIAGHAGTGAITVPSAKRAPSAATDVTAALTLFGRPGAAGGQASATGLPLVLKGVVAAQPASLSVAYISVDGQPPKPFRVGELVNGATIQGILHDRVLLAAGGGTEYLGFPDPTLTPEQRAAGVQSQPGQPAPGAPSAPPPGATSAAALIARLDASPAANGYQIGQNAPPGLQAGDVIQTVNGATLTDPAAATAALGRAAQAGTAQIQILRDGKPITLTVPTR